MRKILIASLLLGLAACGKGGGGLEGEMKGWKDKMCKCTDKACTEKTMTDYNAWAKTKREAAKGLSEGDMEKLMGIEKELKACRKKFSDDGAAAPTEGAAPAAPPTEGAAPAAPPADKPAP